MKLFVLPSSNLQIFFGRQLAFFVWVALVAVAESFECFSPMFLR
jgi:hypothetical protein